MILKPQSFDEDGFTSKSREVVIDELIPFSRANKEEIINKFGSGNQNADIRYSTKDLNTMSSDDLMNAENDNGGYNGRNQTLYDKGKRRDASYVNSGLRTRPIENVKTNARRTNGSIGRLISGIDARSKNVLYATENEKRLIDLHVYDSRDILSFTPDDYADYYIDDLKYIIEHAKSFNVNVIIR